MLSHAAIPTERPSSLLKRLCHHFSLKVPAQYDALQGQVQFPMGTCVIRVDGETLAVRAEAGDQAALDQVKAIVGSHVTLFGKRDGLQAHWSDEFVEGEG